MDNERRKKQISIKTVLVLTDIVIIFVILAFTVSIMLNVGRNYVKNIKEEKNATHIAWLTENIERNFNVMENVAFSVALDEQIRSVAMRNAYNYEYDGGFSEKNEDLAYVKQKFANVVETFSLRLDSVCLFLAKTDNKIVDEAVPTIIYDDELRLDPDYLEFLNSDNMMKYSTFSYSNEGSVYFEHDLDGKPRGEPSYPVFSVTCKIQDYAATEFYGVVRVCVKPEDFFSETQSVYGEKKDFSFCFISGGNNVFGADISDKTTAKRQIDKYGLTLVYDDAIDASDLVFSQILAPIFPIVIAGISLAVVSIVLFSYFYNKIIAEIRNFDGEGNRKISKLVEIDEYGEKLFGLVNTVGELEKKSYYLEKKQQQAKLLSLQYQINPHFLFNSLELFRCRADISGDETAAEAISDFSDIMRYNISDASATSTLADEIEILKKFIGLFKFKYKNTLKFKSSFGNVPPDTPIMKFLLQPIVENAIKYGKKGKTVMTVSVCASMNDDDIFIKIENDGEPIKKERIEEVYSVLKGSDSAGDETSIEPPKNGPKNAVGGGSSGVGLKNVYDRIKLYYGDKGDLIIDSDEGRRLTSVTVVIPKRF